MVKIIYIIKISKFLIIFALFCVSINISFGEGGDILYTKYKHTPVISSLNKDTKVIGILNKGYILLNNGDFGDYIKVKLTDNKSGYILKNNLGLFNESPYKIGGNYGNTTVNTILYSLPFMNSSKELNLEKGTEFYILHINFINNEWIKIKVASGENKDKVGYIQKNNALIQNINGYENEITKFINLYSEKEDIKTTNTLTGNSIKNNSNSLKSNISNTGSSSENIDELMNSINSTIKNTSSSGYNNVKTDSGSSDENLDELLKSLNSIIK